MITGIEIKNRAPFVGGAAFGAVGSYERIDGVAIGTLDPAHPRNRGIALLDKAPRDAAGLVAYRSDFVLLRRRSSRILNFLPAECFTPESLAYLREKIPLPAKR